MPVRFEVAKRPAQINGALVEIDVLTGNALNIKRINIEE